MPAVTVLMGVHNGEAYLAETLASVAAQSFENYEFLIVDDASRDGTADLLAKAARQDPRIRILTNPTNIGLTRSLNRGLSEARGEFIARIDADDLCMEQRLERQLAFMRENPACVGVTSGFVMVDARGQEMGRTSQPLDDWQIRWLLGWNPPAPHPTYFFRRCPDADKPIFYDETFRTAQDFDLWGRLAGFGPTARMAEPLVQYRRHDGAITHSKRYEQAQNCAAIGRANLEKRLPQEVMQGLEPLIDLFAYNATAHPDTIKAAVLGAQEMIRHDRSAAGVHYKWMKRQTAGILADAILSRAGGLSSPASVAAFMWHARAFLPALVGAVLSDPATAIKSLKNTKRA